MTATEQSSGPIIGYDPQPMQKVFHTCPAREILYGGSAGGGKMLDIDTLVPTPAGWTTMGALVEGDEIFDENGAVCRVVIAHPVVHEPESYEITFDDGSAVWACADHLWLTYTADDLLALTKRTTEYRARRRERRPSRATGSKSAAFTATITARNQRMTPATLDAPTGAIRTTAEIAATLKTERGRTNHAIPVAGALQLPERDLPLDPYLFGLWLGDGATHGGKITTADDEVVAAFRDAGFTVVHYGKYDYGINGLQTILRSMGVLGNKHVPVEYRRAGAEQRLALLQGLMDSDGTATSSGSVEFTSTKLALALTVQELAVSLGHKAVVRTGRATLNGKDCGPKYRIKWTPPEIVFRLERKAARQKVSTRRTTKFRYVTGCERIAPTPMRCITVDSPSGLYLVGLSFIPTHNTDATLNEQIRKCLTRKGHKGIIFRRTSPELQDIRDRSMELLYNRGVAVYNHNDDRWTFPEAGSYLSFSHLQMLSDVYKHQGKGYTDICFDEWTHFLPEQVEYLKTRNRTVQEGQEARILGGSNPGGIAHVYIKDAYVEPRDEFGTLITDAELIARYDFERGRWVRYPAGTRGTPGPYIVWRGELTEAMRTANVERAAMGVPLITAPTRCYIPAKLKDNKYLYLDPGYHARLASIPDENQRKALMDGDWDIFEGQFFSSFNPNVHVVDEVRPDTDLAGWRFWRSVDWGWTSPFCGLWHAQDPETDEIVTFDEVYEAKLSDAEQARRLRDQWPNIHIDKTLADPSSYWRGDSREDSLSRADIYEREGVLLSKANNSRIDGWSRVRDLLAINPKTGRPFWRVTRNCRNLIRTIPQMVYDENNKEDLDTDGEDHACFIAGTMVATPDGERPIETIHSGDTVLTREGPRRVRLAGMTATDALTLTVHLSNGRTLTGTGNHPVWVEGEGWVRLDALRYGDIMNSVTERYQSWNVELKPWSLRASRIGATPTRRIGRIATTSDRVPAIAAVGMTPSTVRSGSIITAISPLGATSTIETGIRRTTTLATCTARPETTTSGITATNELTGRENTLSGFVRWLRNGIALMLVVRGTGSMDDGCGMDATGASTPASIAMPSSPAVEQPLRSSARTSAAPPPVERLAPTTRSGRAWSVVRRFKSIVTNQPAPAPVHVVAVSKARRSVVYNLAVEGVHEYYANGVLVHNCDAWRYGMMDARTLQARMGRLNIKNNRWR